MNANLNCALPATESEREAGWRGAGAAPASYHKSVSVAHYVQHAVNAGISQTRAGEDRRGHSGHSVNPNYKGKSCSTCSMPGQGQSV